MKKSVTGLKKDINDALKLVPEDEVLCDVYASNNVRDNQLGIIRISLVTSQARSTHVNLYRTYMFCRKPSDMKGKLVLVEEQAENMVHPFMNTPPVVLESKCLQCGANLGQAQECTTCE